MKIFILQVYSLEDWDPQRNPRITKIVKLGNQRSEEFNYWDYQDAWINVLYIKNHEFKHSWFIKFRYRSPSLPIWFYQNWWLKLGNTPQLLSNEMKQEALKRYPNIEEFNLMRFCNETGLPLILRWEFEIKTEQFPLFFIRKIYVKKWNIFDEKPTLQGYKLEKASISYKNPAYFLIDPKMSLQETYEVLRENYEALTREMEKASPMLQQIYGKSNCSGEKIKQNQPGPSMSSASTRESPEGREDINIESLENEDLGIYHSISRRKHIFDP